MTEKQKTSEKLKAFLDFLRESELQYRMAYDGVNTEDKRGQDLLHMIEFEKSSKERGKLCTKLRQSRIERRKYKDMVEELQPIVDFLNERQYKKSMDHLSQMLGQIRKVEKYHENRTYHPRVEK